MTADVILEVDGGRNDAFYLPPLGERLRGRFDPLRMTDPGPLRQRFPQPIPGQRIGLDVRARKAYVLEPLHDDENATVREQVEKVGKLPPPVKEIEGIDPATWIAWLRWGLEAGVLRVVEGKMPTVEGTPRVRFVGVDQPDPIDRLVHALEDQAALLRQLLRKVAEK